MINLSLMIQAKVAHLARAASEGGLSLSVLSRSWQAIRLEWCPERISTARESKGPVEARVDWPSVHDVRTGQDWLLPVPDDNDPVGTEAEGILTTSCRD